MTSSAWSDGGSYWPTFESVAALPLAKAVKRYPHGVTVELKVPDNGSGFGTHDALTWLPPQYFTDPTVVFRSSI